MTPRRLGVAFGTTGHWSGWGRFGGEFARRVAARGDWTLEPITPGASALHALGTNLAAASMATPGFPVNAAVAFVEDTALTDEARRRRVSLDVLVSGSTWMRDLLDAHGIASVAIPQGVRPPATPPTRTHRWGQRVVVFAGGKLEYRKGQDLALRAFQRLLALRPDGALLVTAWQNPWPATARELPAAGRVQTVPEYDPATGRFDVTGWAVAEGLPAGSVVDLGVLAPDDIWAVLAECDVALALSRGEGGTNLVAMEALAAGVPTVLTDATGHRDLLHGDRACPWAVGVGGTASRATDAWRGTEGWVDADPEAAAHALDRALDRVPPSDPAAWSRRWTWDECVDGVLARIAEAETAAPRVAAPVPVPPTASPAEVAALAMTIANDVEDWDRIITLGRAWEQTRQPMPPVVRSYYGRALQSAGLYDEGAIHSIAAAEALLPREHMVQRVGAALFAAWGCYRTGRQDAGDTWVKRAIRMKTDAPAERHTQALLRLGINDRPADGWRDNEVRHELAKERWPDDAPPMWDGKAPGRVLVMHEQGLGDTVIALRFLPWIAEVSGEQPRVAMWPSERRYAVACGGLAIDTGPDAPPVRAQSDWAVKTLSLPWLYDVVTRGVPAPVAPPALVEARQGWRRGDTLRVGVCWRGSDRGHHNVERSTTPATFAALQDVPGVELVNLTHAADVTGLSTVAPVTFDDTMHCATVAATCDVVVSVDTLVAHLAGSLGVPTLVLPPTVPDWRWGRWMTTTTPWYPSVVVVRRPHANAWPEAIAAVCNILEQVQEAR